MDSCSLPLFFQHHLAISSLTDTELSCNLTLTDGASLASFVRMSVSYKYFFTVEMPDLFQLTGTLLPVAQRGPVTQIFGTFVSFLLVHPLLG